MASARGAYRQAASALTKFGLKLAPLPLSIGRGCRFYGRPLITVVDSSCRIILGERVTLTSKSWQTALGVNHAVVLRAVASGATIEIGSDTGISGGSICAAHSVRIGVGCLLGANVVITDTDFHPVDQRNRRYRPLPRPQSEDRIEIGDDVFIGTGAIVLPGSTIEDHAVIGAGAVVKGHVQRGEVVAGNPARTVRFIQDMNA